jgi:hypothetical protein
MRIPRHKTTQVEGRTPQEDGVQMMRGTLLPRLMIIDAGQIRECTEGSGRGLVECEVVKEALRCHSATEAAVDVIEWSNRGLGRCVR